MEINLEITIEWQRPVQLSENKQALFDENCIPEEISNQSGVYFFARWYDETVSPFYIGQSLYLRNRLKQHLQEKTLSFIVNGIPLKTIDIKKGPKYFHYGYFHGKPGQQPKTCIEIVERQMIRQALQAGAFLINDRGTAPIPTHQIIFEGPPERFMSFPRHTEIEA